MSYVTEGQPSPHSPAEKRLHDIATTEGRLPGWVFNRKLCLDGYVLYPDLSHEGAKVAIEIDGGTHLSYEAVLRDGERDDLMRKHGWVVHRRDHGRALREPYDLIDWAERAVLEMAEARRSIDSRRDANRLAAARRRVSVAVQKCVDFELEQGAITDAGARAKDYYTRLKRMYGAADARTLEEHNTAREALESHLAKMVAEAAAKEPDYTDLWGWCPTCCHDHFKKEIFAAHTETLNELISENPPLTWDELMEELRMKEAPRNDTSWERDYHHECPYLDLNELYDATGGDFYTDDDDRWYNA